LNGLLSIDCNIYEERSLETLSSWGKLWYRWSLYKFSSDFYSFSWSIYIDNLWKNQTEFITSYGV